MIYNDDADEYVQDGYELEPCPFCCSTLVELWEFHVLCESCGAAGPELLNWKIAVRAWNEMPRQTGGKLNKQRARWKSRLRADKKAAEHAKAEAKKAQKAEAERNRVWSEERKAWVTEATRDREYQNWAADRARWLASPINENEVVFHEANTREPD